MPRTAWLLGAFTLASACSSASRGSSEPPSPSAEALSHLAELRAIQTQKPRNPHDDREDSARVARVRSRGLADPGLAPVAISVELRPEAASEGAVLHLLRSADRIGLTWTDSDEAWLFERNPMAPDELTGVRIDHTSGLLVDYTDSDLYSEGVIDGWAQLAQAFIAPEELDGLRPTGEQRSALGTTFERLVAAGEVNAGSILELDWNAELALPLRVVRQASSGTRVQELVALDLEPDLAELGRFAGRWPAYDRKELSDWREDIHAHDRPAHEE